MYKKNELVAASLDYLMGKFTKKKKIFRIYY